MSEENTTPKEKRHYVKRQAEFYDMDIATLLALKDDLNNKLKIVNKSLKEVTSIEMGNSLHLEHNELVNKRIRIYARLRKIGHDTMSVRRSKAAEKKALTEQAIPEQAATATPEAPTTPSEVNG